MYIHPCILLLTAGKVELPPVRGAGYEPSAASGEPTGVALEWHKEIFPYRLLLAVSQTLWHSPPYLPRL
jgi:hypothetical protein